MLDRHRNIIKSPTPKGLDRIDWALAGVEKIPVQHCDQDDVMMVHNLDPRSSG
jgi:hypothetical protein